MKVRAQLPAARGAEQEAPAPSSTVTFPLGEPEPGAMTETEKLTVTGCPTTEALGLRFEIARLVSALSTWCDADAEDPLKLASPANETLKDRVPEEVKVREQLPAASGAEQEAPAPSSTVTFPDGDPAPGATTETAKLTETGCPTTDALGLRFETTIEVSALST